MSGPTPPPPEAGTRLGLVVSGVSKRFAAPVLSDIDLEIAPGEVLGLTGPSGAGKTTLCRLIAGLARPDAGRIALGGIDLSSVPPARRRVAMMFESYGLYPHLTVRENVRSPLEAAGIAPAAAVGLVDEILAFLEIDAFADRRPGALSGGQKQRVALARTLVQTPALTLLDEPLSHLDAKLRHRLRGEIRRRLAAGRNRAGGAPTLWATPDGLEALAVGDRVAVIDGGRIEQVGTPEALWLSPASVRVARLLGDPPINLLQGRLHHESEAPLFRCGGATLPLPARMAGGSQPEATLGIRPDAIDLVPPDRPGALAATLYTTELFGKWAIVTAAFGGHLLKVKTSVADALALGGDLGRPLGLATRPDGFLLFDGADGRAVPHA